MNFDLKRLADIVIHGLKFIIILLQQFDDAALSSLKYSFDLRDFFR